MTLNSSGLKSKNIYLLSQLQRSNFAWAKIWWAGSSIKTSPDSDKANFWELNIFFFQLLSPRQIANSMLCFSMTLLILQYNSSQSSSWYYIVVFSPVFLHKLLEISSSRLGSKTKACGKWVFFWAKSIIWGDLSGQQGLWVCFVIDIFKFLWGKKNAPTL